MINRKIIWVLFPLLILLSSVSAVIWSPQGNVSLKNRYYITNDPIDSCPSGQFVIGKNDSGKWNCSSYNTAQTPWLSNIDANAFSLTDLGELVMSGVITSYDLIPYTTELYSLGNSTKWFEEAYIKNLYSENINTSNIDSNTINVDENLTLGNVTMLEEDNILKIYI